MRTHHVRAPFHFLRATSLSTGILSLAAGAHVLGGGDLPSPEILLAVLALTVLTATTATRMKLNFAGLAALLGAGQLALHEVFTAFSTPVLAAGHPAPDAHHLSGTAIPALEATAHLHATDSTAGVLMVVTHAVATAACALLLAKGEAALWALAAWLKPLIRLPEATAPDAGPPRAVPGAPAVLPLRPWRNLRQHSRRGPPSAVVLP
ncbi:hypothetical protein [Pseudarthrobacter sulfonivorans]|uniref:hypothetical protein n=1 Tax=Pseudarthrobacter sulfonivorans TaxID=121292 RepID=UPI002861EE96|nr:hypothetical protein [Pseudarthrobacter sulfonivorans]MDR6414155.1 hypothetical protein [Pseudarthrobacter sulfonivorans]